MLNIIFMKRLILFHVICNRTTGARRRLLACKKKPDVLIGLCTRAMRAIPATYILMD